MESFSAPKRTSRVMRAISSLDFFPKSHDDVKERASFGAVVTILGIIIISFLFVSETLEYTRYVTEDTVYVDTSREDKMTIFLDMTFINLMCSEVNIDVVDGLGDHYIGVTARINKQPVNGEEMYKSVSNGEERSRVSRWFSGLSRKEAGAKGCRVKGEVFVSKVKGNLHIAAGHSSVQDHSSHQHHAHHLQAKDLNFDVSHIIHQFSFGRDWGNRISPLDGLVSKQEKMTQVNYYLNVVPTVYEPIYGEILETQQYSVSEHVQKKQPGSMSFPLPGVFFKWDLSPFMIKYVETKESFAQYLTRVCAITGGAFVAVGLFYRSTSAAVEKLKKQD